MPKHFIPWACLLLAASALHAQSAGPTAFQIKPAEAYDVSKLPDDHYGRLVKYGQELTSRTFAYIGPEVKNIKMRYAGNNLACASCHQAGATKKFAIPWVGVQATYPQYRGRDDEVGTLQQRVNDCMERSMAGKALPLDSLEMKAFTTYMHFLSKDVPVGGKVEGLGVPAVQPPNRRADLDAGSKVYAAKCVACHGAEGAGVRAGAVGSATGYTFPPLWGKDSFNHGAGMGRLLEAYAFIKTNMPWGSAYGQTQLTDDEAYDVAGFVLSKPRPIKTHTERDYPARWNKPVDSPYPPYVDGAPEDQHRFGPFPPLQEHMKTLKDSLLKTSGR